MVEFAIVAVVFFMLLLGIMDFGRMLFRWNAAAEATRWGARLAVVCDKLTPNQIRDRMRRIVPELTDANIVITYYDPEGTPNNSCDKATCKGVEVRLANFAFTPISPFMNFGLTTVPPFQTYLTRESMESVNARVTRTRPVSSENHKEPSLKIAVISPNSAHLEDIGRYLQTPNGSRSVALHEGGMSKVRVVVDQQRPDLIILDSMCRDLEGLPVLEYVSAQHPHTVIVMLCANHTPDFLIHAMRAGVREVLKSPVTKEVLLSAVERIEQRLGLAARPRDPGTIAAFIPCKGGSGATFIATNLGYQLAAENKKVLLIDLNLQFGDAVLFIHDNKPATNLGDVARNIQRLDASFLAGNLVKISPNYGVLAAPEDPGQAIEIKPEHIDVLLNVAVNHYDFVLLDSGRVLDAVTIKALDRANYVFPVMQLTLPFVRDRTA